jgi:hypothetical protein
MRLLRSTCVLLISLPFSATRGEAQIPTEHPELIGGPWEVGGTSGIDGIFFEIETSSSGPTGREQFDWQTMNIRVYHREGGKETWGYFGTKDKARPQSYSMQDDHSFTLFDGERLRIHFIDTTDIKPFDLDITFSAASREWTGTWSRSGQSSNVVLKRPAPNPGVTPNVFVGDWIGESPPHFLPGSLHIRQSRDGALCAWSNRTTSAIDPKSGSIHNNESNGVWLKVSSATDARLVLDTTNAMGPPSQFRGTLSEVQQVLTGTWERTGGGRLSAPDKFRRAPSPVAQ